MKLHAWVCSQRTIARVSAAGCAGLALAAILFSCALGSRASYAGEDGNVHWASVAEAQVKIDQTTPLTWGVYQAEKKGKPDKKLANLVLLLVGHRYLLMELKSKKVYEVPRKELHAQGDGVDSGDLLADATLVPASDWIWRDVGPADLYRVTLDDYGRVLQLTLPHPYLISPYY